jgi:hypothetical protein
MRHIISVHKCVQFFGSLSKIHASLVLQLLHPPRFFRPNYAFLEIKLHWSCYGCKLETTSNLMVNKNILTNFWQCMPKVGAIKWFEHAQDVASQHKAQSCNTSCQIGPLVLDISQNNLWKITFLKAIKTWIHSYATCIHGLNNMMI